MEGPGMSKRATVVVDLQNEYLPSGKVPLPGIERSGKHAARDRSRSGAV